MNRQATLLTALGIVLLLVLFYLFAWQPKSEELAEVRTQIDDAVAEQSLLQRQITSLEAVRATAPEIEAALASAESLVPREAALPSALRQLQLAADDSGVELLSIAAGRPEEVEDLPELARLSLAITAEGSYFQLIDFLRRVEDPAITPRVMIVGSVSVTEDEYPTLSVAVTGAMFAILPAPPATEPEPVTPEPTESPTDSPTEEEETAA